MTSARRNNLLLGRLLGVGTLAITVMAAAMSLAHAGSAYPPGWNVQRDVPKPAFDFIPGQWNDSKRYWPEQTAPGNNPSHDMAYPPVLYQLTPGGGRYHSVQ
jgi:ABC-type Na+ efflux pump permease subunit